MKTIREFAVTHGLVFKTVKFKSRGRTVKGFALLLSDGQPWTAMNEVMTFEPKHLTSGKEWIVSFNHAPRHLSRLKTYHTKGRDMKGLLRGLSDDFGESLIKR